MSPYAASHLGFTVCQSNCLPVSKIKRVIYKEARHAADSVTPNKLINVKKSTVYLDRIQNCA